MVTTLLMVVAMTPSVAPASYAAFPAPQEPSPKYSAFAPVAEQVSVPEMRYEYVAPPATYRVVPAPTCRYEWTVVNGRYVLRTVCPTR
jgi:hypothetical protein